MGLEPLTHQIRCLESFASAQVYYLEFVLSGEPDLLAKAAQALCAAGDDLVNDDVFWAALSGYVEGSMTTNLIRELSAHKDEFLDLERNVLTNEQNPHPLLKAQADALLAELDATIDRIAARSPDHAPSPYDVELLRRLIHAANEHVCRLTEIERAPGGVRRAASWIWRQRKRIGGVGVIAADAMVGVGAIVVPPASILTPGSILVGLDWALD